MLRLLLVLSPVLAIGAATASRSAPPASLAQACPALTAAERAEIERAENDRSIFRELTWYSRENCVSLGEARRRMDIQNRDAVGAETEPGGPPPRPRNGIGTIAQALEAKAAATFAGLWIEHRPTYRVVVAFTRDAAATLRKYTDDPLFVPLDRPGPSLAELAATQRRLFRDLVRYGARPAGGGTYVQKGRVEISALGDLGAFRAAVARGEVALPSYVAIHEPAPLKHAAPSLPADWRATVRAFPRAKSRSDDIELAILRTGKLVLEDGCFRLKDERRNPVIVWPNEAALDLTGGRGTARVLNRASGEAIEVGRTISLGGNARELADDGDVIDADPACPGPYFLLGDFGPMDRFDESQVQGRASELEQQQRGLSRSEALRLAREERAREDRFRELGERLLEQEPDGFAGVYPYQGRATVRYAEGRRDDIERATPVALRPFVQWEPAPRPLAALRAEKNRFLDQVEALSLGAEAHEDVGGGRIIISAADLHALGRAAVAGQVTIPPGAQVQANGAMPEGEYGDARLQVSNRALEAVPDWAEMRALVEGTMMPGFLVTFEEGEPDRAPTRAQSLEITRFLISLGYAAADLRALHAEALFPARAYVEQNGRATMVNRALLAQEVAVVEVVEVTPERLGDGYRSTVRVRVVEPLKGDLVAGEEARVRLISGIGSDGKHHQSNEEPLLVPGFPVSMDPGSRWLMLLSEGMRARQAALVGGTALPARDGPRLFAPLYGAWRVSGDEVEAAYAEPSPGDLPAIRAQIAPVDTAFDRASRARGVSLQRRLVP